MQRGYVVQGFVQGKITRVSVLAFARRLRSEDLLGRSSLEPTGFYSIPYSVEPGERDHEPINLVVKVVGPRDQILAESEVRFNAGPRERIDLVIPEETPRSEFERYLDLLSSPRQQVDLADLTADDIDFLATQTRIPDLHIALLAAAAQAERETEIPAGFFYGLYREGLPTEPAALALHPASDLIDAYGRAADRGTAPRDLAGRATALARQLASQAPALLEASEDLGPLLKLAESAGLTARERTAFLQAVIETPDPDEVRSADDAELADVVDRIGRLSAAKRQRLREGLQVAALIGGAGPLFGALLDREAGSFAGLARLGEEELTAIIAALEADLDDGDGDGDDGGRGREDVPDPRARAEAILLDLEEASPATLAAVALSRGALPDIEGAVRADLARALPRLAGIDLRALDLAAHLAEHPDVLADTDRERTTRHLERLQRVLRLVPRAADAMTLLEQGLDSAHAVADLPETDFVETFADALGGADAALEAHERARTVRDAAALIVTSVASALQDASPAAAMTDREALRRRVDDTFPDLQNLFGNASYCECRHCRSVLSPAAYFVDLMQYLGPKGRAVLFGNRNRPGRRPDLAHLPLSCENTHTPLPHIDLVNEILEYQVVHGRLDAGAARDTSDLTADQLRAGAPHVLDAAYDELRQAVFPAALPFHRELEIVRRYLGQLGSSRLELMRTLGGAPDDAVAAEVLGISQREHQILVRKTRHGLAAFFGGRGVDELTVLSEFLRATGASVAGVEEWIATRFIARVGDLELVISEDCRPDSSRLVGLTEEHLWRGHRLLRLAHRLDWSLTDVDRALAAFAADDLDEDFLRTLAQAVEIKNRLGLHPASRLLVLWGEISWRGRDDLYSRLFLSGAEAENPVFQLPAEGPPLADDSQRLAEHAPRLARAFRISIEGLAALFTHFGLDQPSSALSLANVSTLYRAVVLARAVRLSIRNFLDLLTLTAVDPFAGVDATRHLLDVLDVIRDSDLRLRDIQQLLRGIGREHDVDAELQAALDLATVLRQAAAADEDDAPPQVVEFLHHHLAEAHGTPLPMLSALLDHLPSPSDPGRRLEEDLLALRHVESPEPGDGDIGAQPVPEAIAAAGRLALLRLEKAIRLASSLGLGSAEIRFVASRWGRLWSLPAERSETDVAAIDEAAPALFADLLELLQTVELRDTVAGGDGPRMTAVLTADDSDALASLAAAADWDADLLRRLASADVLGLDAGDLRSAAGLRRLRNAVRLTRHLGVDIDFLIRLARAEPSADDARELAALVAGKYDFERWPDVAQALNDPLRELQRDALVAFLVHRRGLRDANELYEKLLIDPEMAACHQTSRVRAAIAAVQLFVQRALLEQEPRLPPSSLDGEEWEWMKTYRVWEANRKVFLWPENWLEPELRDDATPLFREMESELLQGELTEASAERAFLGYLQKLHQIARLEICGLCQDPSDGSLHVVGRTFESPRVYFHCRRLRGHWTPWQRIEVDVEGDHVLPFAADRRLYLFWLSFSERQDEDQRPELLRVESFEHWHWRTELMSVWKEDHDDYREDHKRWKHHQDVISAVKSFFNQSGLQDEIGPWMDAYIAANPKADGPEPPEPQVPREPSYADDEPLRHWQVRLAWSEFKDGTWSARETSQQAILSPTVLLPLAELGQHLPWFSSIKTWIQNNLEDPGDAIVSQFLPLPEHHLARIRRLSGDGRLEVQLYRRYVWTAAVADQQAENRGADFLGTFTVQCGARTVAASQAQPFNMHANPVAWEDLALPADASSAGSLVIGKGPVELSGGRVSTLLKLAPQTPWSIVPEADADGFQLSPPFEPFAFQDQQNTFVAAPGPGARRRSRATASLRLRTRRDRSLVADRRAAHGDTHRRHHRRVAAQASAARRLVFHTAFHPQVCAFLDQLYAHGIPGLLAKATQGADVPADLFENLYEPSPQIGPPLPELGVELDLDGMYGVYNWELFFHAPLRIAISLSRGQRFEEAQRWFHFLFDPSASSREPRPGRYWGFKPFADNLRPEKQAAAMLLERLHDGDRSGAVAAQIDAWRDDPFNPHLLARMRITAYQKQVVRKYLEHLLDWADHLFRRDTAESVAEAAQMYVLAGELLGERPTALPGREAAARTWAELDADVDAFGNALVALEQSPAFAWHGRRPVRREGGDSAGRASHGTAARRSRLPAPTGEGSTGRAHGRLTGGLRMRKGLRAVAAVHRTPYFRVPHDERLLELWDRVADRLFKVRNCLDLDGVARRLPLFEPPIDPALLVRARAAGLDLSSVLSDLHMPRSRYRFSFLVQKAHEACRDVKALGGALLSALEKRDAEALQRLRARHEGDLLRAVREVRRGQIEEAQAVRDGLLKSRRIAKARHEFFRDVEYRIPPERTHENLLQAGQVLSSVAQSVQSGASAAHGVPDFSTGTSGLGGHQVQTFGGSHLAGALRSAADMLQQIARVFTDRAERAAIVASRDRRWADWKLQETLAKREIEQIDQQIAAADVRIALTERELENHELRRRHADEVESFLTSKLTGESLYDWMAGTLSQVYYQAWGVAHELAKQAESAFRFERVDPDAAYIGLGHWQSSRKGLLAGERLALDLQRMEHDSRQRDERRYELTKHVSLKAHAPFDLLTLKETGSCVFELREDLFDADFPGHYQRRLHRVSLTIPCVVGPYTGIHARLTLLASRIRVDPSAVGDYPRAAEGDDRRFLEDFSSSESIATSHAQNDGGVFELDFHDQRYLPFEGAGAVSRWQLDLPLETNAFDRSTITDVVIHLRYTAREGGEALRARALEWRRQALADLEGLPQARLVSCRHELPDAWHRLFHAQDPGHVLTAALPPERFPYLFRGRRLDVHRVDLFLKWSGDTPTDGTETYAAMAEGAVLATRVTLPDGSTMPTELRPEEIGGMLRASVAVAAALVSPWEWRIALDDGSVAALDRDLKTDDGRLLGDAVEDLVLVLSYTVG